VDDFARLPSDERRLYFEQAAARLGLSAQIIEKDFLPFAVTVKPSGPRVESGVMSRGLTAFGVAEACRACATAAIPARVAPRRISLGSDC